MTRRRKEVCSEDSAMLRTIEGIYEYGIIHLKESFQINRTKVIVTFLDEGDSLKALSDIPGIFRNPIKVDRIIKISREDLHER
jgi:hypothetical protein